MFFYIREEVNNPKVGEEGGISLKKGMILNK